MNSNFIEARTHIACSAALAAVLMLGTGEASAQGASPPTAGASSAQPAAEAKPARPGGLTIGPHGLTVGPGGGLEMQYKRNSFSPDFPSLPADAPAPNPDPRNFEGSWHGEQYLEAWEIQSDLFGNAVPFNETGRSVMERRLMAMDRQAPFITPAVICRPGGPVRDLIRVPLQIFQSKNKIDVFSGANRTWWQIALKPSLAPPADVKTYTGRSIGHWDGDTLVVETTGFKHRLYLAFRGTPLSTKGKLTQRIRKVYEDRWLLEMVTTVDDPTFYTRPWSFARSLAWRPDYAGLGEYDCEIQAGDKNNDPAAGFEREPDEY